MTAPARPRRRGRRLLTVGMVATAIVLTLASGLAVFAQQWAQPEEDVDDPLATRGQFTSPQAVCSLLSAEDVQMAFGYPYAEGVHMDDPSYMRLRGVAMCIYMPYDYLGGNSAAGGGWVMTGVVDAYAEEVFDRDVDFDDDDVVEVSWPGKRAAWTGGLGELVVLTDQRIVTVRHAGRTHVRPAEDRKERSQRLAERMIERLP